MNHHDETRAFIAVPLPEKIKILMENIILDLKNKISDNSVKWVQPNNIHLTLAFIVNVSKVRLDQVASRLLDLQGFQPSTVKLSKIGAFPSLNNPRVIWVGITNEEKIVSLAQSIRHTINEITQISDNKSFSAHLTLGRIKPQVTKDQLNKIKQVLFNHPAIPQEAFEITGFCLYESILTPQGPRYSELGCFPSKNC